MELGPFVALEEIGRGGSGVVYAAERPAHSGRGRERVALKVQHEGDEASAARFLAEAEMLGRVAHPAIVRVIESGTLPDGRAYLAMPLLDGETLAARLAHGPLGLEEALRVFGALASGVRALHEAGLVHRDIKAENVILVGDPPAPVLLDLGIAKDTAAADSTATREGVIRGTPATMAPERFFGQPASVASDVYELAVLLHQMLLGALPWADGSDADARLVVRPPREIDPGLPAHLSDAILDALATRPARRPVSVKALCDRVLRPEGTSGGRTTVGTPSLAGAAPLANVTPPGTTRQLDRPSGAPPAAPAPVAPAAASPLRRAALPLAAALAVVAAFALGSLQRREAAPQRAEAPEAGAPAPAASEASGSASASAPPGAPADAPASAAAPAQVDVPAPVPAEGSAAPPRPLDTARALASAAAAPAPGEADPLPSASPGASAAPTLKPVAAQGVFAEFPACHTYATEACDGDPKANLREFCRAEIRRAIERKKPAERAKSNADCQRDLSAMRKRVAANKAADELIATQLPACKAWVDKSCSPEVKGRDATRSFCFFNQDSARNLAEKRPSEANALCQKRLDDWQNEVDRAVAKKGQEDADRERARAGRGVGSWNFIP